MTKRKRDSEEEPQQLWDEWDGEYIGNIWGWKNSFISLGILLFMLGLMGYLHLTMEPQNVVSPETEMVTDTLSGKQ